ncbi:MAG TPA: PEP-CTERM sorting domain-containing protein [Chthoniobacterales bacterium]
MGSINFTGQGNGGAIPSFATVAGETLARFETGERGTGIFSVVYIPKEGSGIVGDHDVALSVSGRLNPVPEPSGLALVAAGLLSCGGTVFMRRRQSRSITVR